MPPPTAADEWLNSRRFGIVVDAGSSGSRLQIYSWKDARVVRSALGPEASRSLPRVERGTQNDEDWLFKVEPGISSFADHPDDISTYLAPLLNHAQTHIPPSLHHETPLFLLATAGMRLLSPEQQVAVLRSTCQFLKFHSNFRIDDASPAGPCGSSVRIISGEEEGLFGWLSVNYLMDGFGSSNSGRATYGFLDMGGASTQIAFEPSAEEQEKTQNLMDVRLRMMDGEEISHRIFVTTWLGFGTNQARERYVGQAIKQHERSRPSIEEIEDSPTSAEVIEDPCLPSGLVLAESPLYVEPATPHEQKIHTLYGTGSLERCLQETLPLLNKTAPCPDPPCLFNGVYVPPIDFSVSHFIGISEYWYSSEHIFGLGGTYDFVHYERAAEEFCGRPWQETLQMYEDSKNGQTAGHDGGEGTIRPAKWGDRVDVSRLEMQCFKAAWIINVLHEGFRMPRIVDPGGNDTTEVDHDAKDRAEKQGLSRPHFQSVDTVGDMAISWTLGKMVLEASKEVPPLVKDTKPLPDPHEPVPEANDAPTQLIRPPFPFGLDAIDDHISSHLPPSLTRLGFPLAAVLSCLFMVLFVSCISYRLRRYVRICLRRLTRFSSKRDRDLAELSMEQGGTSHDDSPISSSYSPRAPSAPSSWWRRYLRRFTSMGRRHRPLQYPIYRSLSRQAPPSLARPMPLRQSTSSTLTQPFDASTTASRSSSPTLGGYDDHVFFKNVDGGEASSISLYSRSRNSSTISLSVLVPRQTLSRTNSAFP